MRVVITLEIPGMRDQYRQAVLGLGMECAASDCPLFKELPARLVQPPKIDLLLVVFDGLLTPALETLKYAVAHANVPVLAVGPTHDPQLIMQALRTGAREYLDRARLREEMLAALDKMETSGRVASQQGKLIAVTAAVPGTGVTTVATGLAFAFAAAQAGEVVLAEFSNGVPEIALDLDLKPRHPLNTLTRDWERLDVTMIQQALVVHDAKVKILAQAPDSLTPALFPPGGLRQVMILLRKSADLAVLDLGHAVHESAADAFQPAEAIVVVTKIDVPSLRLTRLYLRQLQEIGISLDKIHVVGNRYGQKKQLDWRKAEESLGVSVRLWLPDDPAALNDALNTGQPLVKAAARASITKKLAELAQKLQGSGS